MGKARKAITAAGLAVGLALTGAVSAQAVGSQTNFLSTAGRLQKSHYWTAQNRTTKSASQVHFNSIGGDGGYTMNVKAQNQASKVMYAEHKGIGTGTTVPIANSTPVGTATRRIVTNNTWALVNVTISGWFKTN
jgi:hypothetical protein